MDTPVEMIEKFRGYSSAESSNGQTPIQFVQLMGIDHIGFQGQEFDEKVIGRVKHLRLKYPGLPISVDGGVSLENAQSLFEAGADRLVVGSAIFNSDNFVEAIANFKKISV
jgi:ribulose-phosphate 3-epimerase